MTVQIAVRLPDDLVDYLDSLVAAGDGSRAVLVTRALRLYQQHSVARRDAQILEDTGDYDDFDGLSAFAAIDD